jgi:hypothetical protein
LNIRILEDAAADLLANGEDRRLPVRQLLGGQRPTGCDPLLLVTSRDLALRGCLSLFGYADRRRGVAVVSTFRLSGDGEDRLAARLTNVIAHERGHLDGLRHCRAEGCVMHPVQSVRDLDARPVERCARCRRPHRGWTAYATAAAVSVLVLAGLHASASLVKVKKPPFSWRQERGAGVVVFQHRPVLAVRSEAEARAAALRFNGLFAQLTPPPIEASAEGAGAVLRAGGVTLAAIDSRGAGGGDPLDYAQAWAARMGWLMRAKGTEAEGCPDCHIRRLPEVEAAARLRRQRRW